MKSHMVTNVGQYAIILKDKKLLQLWPPEGPLWLYPGGRLENGDEDYEKALRREIKEELGVEIEIIKPAEIVIWSINGEHHRYGVFFLCELLDEESKIKLSHEHEKYEWVSYEELMEHYSKHPERAKPGIKLAQKLHKGGYI